MSDFRGVEFKPIEFALDGLRRSTEIPGVLSFEIEGVASRNRCGEPFYIDNTAHPASRRLALARAKEPKCRASASSSASPARATTATSRLLAGRHKRRRSRLTIKFKQDRCRRAIAALHKSRGNDGRSTWKLGCRRDWKEERGLKLSASPSAELVEPRSGGGPSRRRTPGSGSGPGRFLGRCRPFADPRTSRL